MNINRSVGVTHKHIVEKFSKVLKFSGPFWNEFEIMYLIYSEKFWNVSKYFEVFQKCQNKTEHAVQSQSCTNSMQFYW